MTGMLKIQVKVDFFIRPQEQNLHIRTKEQESMMCVSTYLIKAANNFEAV